jgi:hypothetical protein
MSRVFGVTNTENCAFLKIMGFIAKKKKKRNKKNSEKQKITKQESKPAWFISKFMTSRFNQ